jgi:hypothetical protein
MKTLETLSAEDRKKVMAEAAELLKQQQATIKEERRQYKELASNEVEQLFVKMKAACEAMRLVKVELFNSLQALIASKREVFDVSGDQKTHTISTLDGTKRVTVGYREVSDWDGTEGAGVEKVQAYVQSLAKNDASAKTVKIINTLLKPDKAGKLDPRRIMELKKIAEEEADTILLDGVSIIMNAYRTVKSKSVMMVEERVEGDKWRNVELDFSDLVITETKAD